MDNIKKYIKNVVYPTTQINFQRETNIILLLLTGSIP